MKISRIYGILIISIILLSGFITPASASDQYTNTDIANAMLMTIIIVIAGTLLLAFVIHMMGLGSPETTHISPIDERAQYVSRYPYAIDGTPRGSAPAILPPRARTSAISRQISIPPPDGSGYNHLYLYDDELQTHPYKQYDEQKKIYVEPKPKSRWEDIDFVDD